MTPLVLGILAVVFAGPLPAVMARATWLRRTPSASLLAWQCVAIAAVLAGLGAGLALVTDHLLPDDASGLPDGTPDPVVFLIATVAFGVTALVAGRLLLSGHRVGADLRRIRRHHAEQVDLLGRVRARGVRVLQSEAPLAYCLPGLNRGRVVVSAGVLERLDPAEVEAVLEHERAHLRFRHDLIVELFDVLHHAFPRWVSSARALAEVRLLVEVGADRSAGRAVGRRPLAQALVQMVDSRAPAAALGASGSHASDLLVRMQLLGVDEPPPWQAPLVALLGLGVVVLPTWLIVAPWLEALLGQHW